MQFIPQNFDNPPFSGTKIISINLFCKRFNLQIRVRPNKYNIKYFTCHQENKTACKILIRQVSNIFMCNRVLC